VISCSFIRFRSFRRDTFIFTTLVNSLQQ